MRISKQHPTIDSGKSPVVCSKLFFDFLLSGDINRNAGEPLYLTSIVPDRKRAVMNPTQTPVRMANPVFNVERAGFKLL